MNLKRAFWPALVASACLLPSVVFAQVAPAAPAAAVAGTNSEPKVAPPLEKAYTNSLAAVFLEVSGGFWAGQYEVTQKEYQSVMGANPSLCGGDSNPVDNVSWNDAMEFCKKLTEKDIASTNLPPNYYYTLPTEEQWEALAADASLDDAVTSLKPPRRTGSAPVGTLKPNSLGLYDTRGNILEYTLGDTSKPYRVLRGGSWADFSEPSTRVIFRNYVPPTEHRNTYGFRCIILKKAGEATKSE